jgi:hypothetical protein
MAWSTEDPPEIFAGEPFTEKKSKFQAFCASCKTIQDVVLFRDTLLENPKIESATHNILAYVTPEEPVSTTTARRTPAPRCSTS